MTPTSPHGLVVNTPSIHSIGEEVVYPWKINVAVSRMTDVQEYRLAMTKTPLRLKTLDQLMAEGSSEGNYSSSSDNRRKSVETESFDSSSSTQGEKAAPPTPTRLLPTPGGANPTKAHPQGYCQRDGLLERFEMCEPSRLPKHPFPQPQSCEHLKEAGTGGEIPSSHQV